MIVGLKIEINTTKGNYSYQFGTHLKKLNSNVFSKILLSEKEILEIKETMYDELNKILRGIES